MDGPQDQRRIPLHDGILEQTMAEAERMRHMERDFWARIAVERVARREATGSHWGSQQEVAIPARRAAPRTIWSARLRAEIPALYEAGRLTTAEIAELLNVTPKTVRRYLPDVSTTDRRRHDVRVLDGRGYVRAAIADTLGLSDRSVSAYRRAGVVPPAGIAPAT
jgi:predicted transcriptional regulator